MTVTRAPGEVSRLTVTFEPNVIATVHDDAGSLRPGRGCLGTPRDVSCGLLAIAWQCYPACSASVDLGDGDDTLAMAGTSQKGPFFVDAGAGDDDVHILGDANAIVDGGPGCDVLRADTTSELDGGPGPGHPAGKRVRRVTCAKKKAKRH